MTDYDQAPAATEIEFSLLGSGTGESALIHLGHGDWLVIDSFLDDHGTPVALRYLNDLRINAADSVKLCTVTHWHADHIRGFSKLLSTCRNADFCCSAVTTYREFVAIVTALRGDRGGSASPVVRELQGCYSVLNSTKKSPVYAMSQRLVFQNSTSKVWALSPSDEVLQRSMLSLFSAIEAQSRTETLRGVPPNETAIVLWIEFERCSILLGSDLERRGWVTILNSPMPFASRASAFKIPHHGAASADLPDVWNQLVEPNCCCAITPWRLGGNTLPSKTDIDRLSSRTDKLWITSNQSDDVPLLQHRNTNVQRALQESAIQVRPGIPRLDMVRLRRKLNEYGDWGVETYGSACRATEYAI